MTTLATYLRTETAPVPAPVPALARAVARLRADGFTPSPGACYASDDGSAYASSVESLGPDTFGAPAHAVEVDADGRMWIRNRPA